MSRYYTPLRYPGGKAKLANFVKELFKTNKLCDGHYAEAYAGGAGVGIELLLCGYASTIHLNDLNYPVYAFWHSVINESENLCKRVSKAKLDITMWRRQKEIIANVENHDLLDVGFAFFYLNRTNRSGIISGGVIGGIDQSGKWKIDARFGKEGLIDRIERIAAYASQINLYNLDAMDFLGKVSKKMPENGFIYLDPPYFHQGQRLYDNFYKPEDHALIAGNVAKLRHQWMVSYDDEPAIRLLYCKYRQTTHYLRYSAATAYQGSEVLIFGNKLKLPDQIERRSLMLTA